MDTKLAENIRLFRKKRGLTQEQLAEVLDVTVGAVHKWEKRLSTPDLGLIVEMADFFDVSVDVLLGYQMKDNRLQVTVERLVQYINTEAPEGVNEAEKALKRFPHSFDVVYLSGIMFMLFGGKNHREALLARALNLLDQSLLLLPQNTNPKISEISIYQYMANVLIMQGKGEQAAELLKQHNQEGIYSDQIGLAFSLLCRQPEEAGPFLSEAFLDAQSKTLDTIIGKAYAYILCNELDSAEELLSWELNTLERLKQPETIGFLDQSCMFLYTLLAYVYLKKNLSGDAEKAMRTAYELAERFDAAPNYDARSFRFIDSAESYSMHIILGSTAKDSITYVLDLIDDEALTALWKEAFRRDP